MGHGGTLGGNPQVKGAARSIRSLQLEVSHVAPREPQRGPLPERQPVVEHEQVALVELVVSLDAPAAADSREDLVRLRRRYFFIGGAQAEEELDEAAHRTRGGIPSLSHPFLVHRTPWARPVLREKLDRDGIVLTSDLREQSRHLLFPRDERVVRVDGDHDVGGVVAVADV